MHHRLQRWADAGWANSVVVGWGLAQGCIVPGLADLFFLPLALARPAHAYRYAVLAASGTILGSITLYVVGSEALHLVKGPVSRLLGLTTQTLDEYRTRLATYGAIAIFVSTLSPLSTKLTSIASGAAGVAFGPFVLALSLGRLTRTVALAWLVRHGGASMVASLLDPGTEGDARPDARPDTRHTP